MTMITGKTTVKINESEYNINVLFYNNSQDFEIIIQDNSQLAYCVWDDLFGKRFSEIVFVDDFGTFFTAYDCICIKKFVNNEVIGIMGKYKTLISGWKIPKRGILTFHFDGIERFFNKFLDRIEEGYSQNKNEWKVCKDSNKIVVYTFVDDMITIENLLLQVTKVREYFEFLVNKEIAVDQVVYSDGAGISIEILNDTFLVSKNICVFDKVSLKRPNEILNGLNAWISSYELYKEVISIWRKTIYNRYVSEEDIFIWKCQSIELLCTLYEPLFVESKNFIQNPKQQSSPNLKNFLEALNKKYNFIKCDKVYFDEVKKVRNVYTHYNPKKHVSEREWWNASHLIGIALDAALQYVFKMDVKEAELIFLKPQGINEEIKR